MKFLISAIENRQKFIVWLAATHPELSKFEKNIDISVIRGRKMTVNNHFGITENTRQLLISGLKEYYLTDVGENTTIKP